MANCPYCNQNISDKALEIHKRLCPKGPGANKPVVLVAAVIKPEPPVIVPTVVIAPPAPVVPAPAPVSSQVTVNEPEKPPVIVKADDTPKVTNGDGSMEVFSPILDPYFITSEFNAEALDITDKMAHDKPTCLLITGHPGCGKTSVGMQLAAKYHRPISIADMGVIMEPQQLFQTTRAIQGKGDSSITDTRESGFVRGLETDGCVVLMDEMNRAENERCLNPLMPILDNRGGSGRGETWIDELRRRVHVADNVIFVATVNEGALFCGIQSIDAALRDRFREIFLDYLPAEQESLVIQNKTGVPKSIADSLAQFAFTVRNSPGVAADKKISTRQLLHASQAYSKGTMLWKAVWSAIGNFNDIAWRQQVLEIFSLNILDDKELHNWLNREKADKWVSYGT